MHVGTRMRRKKCEVMEGECMWGQSVSGRNERWWKENACGDENATKENEDDHDDDCDDRSVCGDKA